MLRVNRSVQGEGVQYLGGRSGRTTQQSRGETLTNRRELYNRISAIFLSCILRFLQLIELQKIDY